MEKQTPPAPAKRLIVIGAAIGAALMIVAVLYLTRGTTQEPSAPPCILTDQGSVPDSVDDEAPFIRMCPPYTIAPLSGWKVSATHIAETLDQPIGITNAGDGSGRLFVSEKAGRIRIIEDNVLLDKPFLDIHALVTAEGLEQGLLGLTFDPSYTSNGFFYVNYTDLQGDTIVARYEVSEDANYADPDSAVVVLKIDQPGPIHNGGQLAFGEDGTLYIAVGEGGKPDNTSAMSRETDTLLGSILRLDVSDLPYSIPRDNPFVDDPDVPDEVWARGFRNPWRFSFDRETGDLYIGDVGESEFEEINLQRPRDASPRHYGWPWMEGFECLDDAPCQVERFNSPLAVYAHGNSCSITGGYVYRGSRFPSFAGVYMFTDYCSGRIWGMRSVSDTTWEVAHDELGIQGMASFGEDEAGEIYLVSMLTGVAYQLVLGVP